jgi:hypothetical protein
MSPKGVLVKHPQGFALVIPWHIAYIPRDDDRPVILGRIRVLGNINKGGLRLAGRVPDSWLVDLNSTPVEIEITPWPLTSISAAP